MTTNNLHHIKLYGGQRDIINAFLKDDRNVVAVVPVGSGKSFLSALCLPIFATDPRYHKGRDIAYIAPNLGMMARIIWKDLVARCIEMYNLRDHQDINHSKYTITFPNGITIHCLSAETSSLKGLNLSVIIADEAAEFGQEALQELTNRIRPRPGEPESQGRLILISTPEGANAFYDIFKFAQQHPDSWIAIHKTYEQMRVQSKDWIEEQRALLSPLKFKKDFLCEWESVTDAFFYSWHSRFIKPCADVEQDDLYMGMDFNKKRMCATIFQVTDPYTNTGSMRVLKNYAIYDCGTEQMAQQIRADFPRRIIRAIIDRTGTHANRDTTSPFGITDATILESYGIQLVGNAKTNPLITDTDNSANAFIAADRLAVDPSCKELIEALNTFHFEDGTRKNLVKSKDARYMHLDGLGDALRYAIHELFKVRHATSSQAEYMDDERGHVPRPGDQYAIKKPRSVNGVPTLEGIIAGLNGDDSSEYWS